MSEELENLKARESRANRLFEYSKFVFLMYFFGITIYFIFQFIGLNDKLQATLKQVRESQIANQESGKENHAKTQAYIRCIGEAILVPVAQRDSIDFDACTVTADDNDNGTNKPTTPTTPASPVTPQSNTQSTPNIPTTSEPPDPEQKKLLNLNIESLPIVNNLFNGLGL